MNYDAFFTGREPNTTSRRRCGTYYVLNRAITGNGMSAKAVIKVNRGLLLVEQRKDKLRAAMEHGGVSTFSHTLSIIFTESCLESIARLWTTTIRSFV
ncbi:TPA: hypothetical protein ACQVJU_005655 [Serratia marcescens]